MENKNNSEHDEKDFSVLHDYIEQAEKNFALSRKYQELYDLEQSDEYKKLSDSYLEEGNKYYEKYEMLKESSGLGYIIDAFKDISMIFGDDKDEEGLGQ